MDALPGGTHLIHIGPQKTGSTAIQAALHAARAELREHGVVYPGPSSKPREAAEMGLGFGRITPRGSMDAWHDLLRQVNDPTARLVCVSLEAFGRATDEQIERVVAELGGDRPHVLSVARRYDTLLPSQWQQRVKSQLRLTYDEWLRVVLGDPAPEDPHWANVWVPHDTVDLLSRWSRVVGPENVTLVVRDEQDRDQLVRCLEQLLGLPAGLLRADAGRANSSLSATQTELVRSINDLFHDREWIGSEPHEALRMAAVRALVNTAPAPGEPRTQPTPAWAWDRLVELSDRRIAGLGELPVRVIGDPEWLRVSRPEGHTEDADSAARVDVDTAARALAAVIEAATTEGRAGRAGRGGRRREDRD